MCIYYYNVKYARLPSLVKLLIRQRPRAPRDLSNAITEIKCTPAQLDRLFTLEGCEYNIYDSVDLERSRRAKSTVQ